MMRYVRTLMLLLAGLSFMIPLLSKPLMAKGDWSENRWSRAHWNHADIDSNLPNPSDDSEPCIEPGQ